MNSRLNRLCYNKLKIFNKKELMKLTKEEILRIFNSVNANYHKIRNIIKEQELENEYLRRRIKIFERYFKNKRDKVTFQ